MVTLREMTPDDVAVVVPRIMDGYVEDRIAAGEDPEGARHLLRPARAALPRGADGRGQHLMHVVDDDQVVGLLWMGRPLSGPEST